MGRKSQHKKKNNINTNTGTDTNANKGRLSDIPLPAKYFTFAGFIALLVFAVSQLDAFGSRAYDQGTLDTRVGNVETELSTLRTELSSLRSDLSELRTDFAVLNNTINIFINQNMMAGYGDNFNFVSFNSEILQTTASNDWEHGRLSAPLLALGDDVGGDFVIGVNENGDALFFDDVIGRNIYTSYANNMGGLDWFYGSLNNNGRWDGDIVLNSYNASGTLVAILEATYNDGSRVGERYISMTPSLMSVGHIVIRDAMYYGSHTDGVSKTFSQFSFSEGIYFKSSRPVRTSDLDLDDGHLIQFYYGEIRGGYFNDNSGEAYLVNFNDDGTIRIIYSGRFANGHFNDVGQASFWIVLSNDETQYMFYQGPFANGQPLNPNWYNLPSARIPQNENPMEWATKFIESPIDFDIPQITWRTWQMW